MTAWTPGPWTVSGATVYAGDTIVSHVPSTYFEELYESLQPAWGETTDAYGRRPGNKYPEGQQVAYRNADLIASAPELYAALDRILSTMESTGPDEGDRSVDVRPYLVSVEAIGQAVAALARAEGVTP